MQTYHIPYYNDPVGYDSATELLGRKSLLVTKDVFLWRYGNCPKFLLKAAQNKMQELA